jgi:hypothetical protein
MDRRYPASAARRAAALDRVLRRHGLAPEGACPLFRLVRTPEAGRLFAARRRRILTRPFADHPDLLRLGLPADDAERARLDAALARDRPMAEPVALAALALDAGLGWPARLHAVTGHPVGAFARLIATCERRWNRPGLGDFARRVLGTVTVALLIAVAALGALAVEHAIRWAAGPLAWPLLALAAWPALAQRSLDDHVRPVIAALARDDLPAARKAVGMIVGRDTAALDHAGIARAAIESLAESFCDGVVAPLFWLLVLGLPGAWAYKAVNTADSLIGHPDHRCARSAGRRRAATIC